MAILEFDLNGRGAFFEDIGGNGTDDTVIVNIGDDFAGSITITSSNTDGEIESVQFVLPDGWTYLQTSATPLPGTDGLPVYTIKTGLIFDNNNIPVSTVSVSTNGQIVTAVCYCEGTLIRTATGDVAVEDLAEGDMLITDQGTQVPVKWIGRQTLSSRFGAPERLMPVRFAAGSLGQDLPHTDLTVTADHGMLVDGVICHAGALVNGSTITRVPLAEMGDRFTVYHIETDAHDMIFANGAVAETFIDNTSRAAFDNYAEFLDRFGEPAERIEADYPRAMSARQVPAHIRARLAPKAAA